jgi:drug/metabolite transporter (DMT)-like permease
MGSQKQILGHLAAFFTIFVWGITFIFTKLLLVSFTPVEIMFFRLVLAVLALFAISPPHLSGVKIDRHVLRHEWKIMLAGLCGVTLFMLFQNIALTYTLAANVSVLISVAPLFTALVSRFVLNEKLKASFFLGFAAAMTGIILIAFNGSVFLKLNPLGDLLSLLAALAWAFYSVLIRKASAGQSNTLPMTRKVFFYGLLLALPVLLLSKSPIELKHLAVLSNLFSLLFLGVVALALCYITWNYAVSILGPVKTSSYIYAIPVVTIVASAFVLQEPLTLVAGIGMLLILAGMIISEREKAS